MSSCGYCSKNNCGLVSIPGKCLCKWHDPDDGYVVDDYPNGCKIYQCSDDGLGYSILRIGSTGEIKLWVCPKHADEIRKRNKDNSEPTSAIKIDSILEEAKKLVHGDRQKAYGRPIRDFSCTAEFFTSYLKRRGILKADGRLDCFDIPILMILLKISREANKHKPDNLVDIAGYAETCQMVHDDIGRVA